MPWTLALGKIIQNKAYFTVKCRMCVLSHFSHAWLFATPWTVAHQGPWESPGKNIEEVAIFSFRGNLLNPGLEPTSLISPALAGRLAPPGSPCRLLKRALKEKNRTAAGSRLSKYMGTWLSWLCGWWETSCCCCQPASQELNWPHID